MQPAGRVIDQDWLRQPDVVAAVSALTAGGGVVRFAGGCVRDALINRPVRDIDMAIDQQPDVVARLLEDAGLKAVPTGLDHGTVTAVADGQPIEVTTLRRDVETFGRHARVEFTDDWVEDAKRRDFTMNALYCDPDGQVYDPTGGLADLEAGRVRFVGDPVARIEEDALRILRFFRFHAWFGTGAPDQPALAACQARKADLDKLSVERISKEMLRLLEAPDPVPALEAMRDAEVLAQVLPEGDRIDCLEQLMEFGGRDPLLRLAALTDRMADTLSGLGARWKLSNADRQRLRCMATGEVSLLPDLDDASIRAQLYWLGTARVSDLAYLEAAHDGRDRHHILQLAENWDGPAFPLRGSDVISMGLQPGERVGDLLIALEQEWVAEDFASDRKTLLRRLAAAIEDEEN